MKEKSEAKKFDEAMEKLLKVSPQLVKDAMKQEQQERAKERRTKRSSSPASIVHKP